jgi:hypothetical protein
MAPCGLWSGEKEGALGASWRAQSLLSPALELLAYGKKKGEEREKKRKGKKEKEKRNWKKKEIQT